MDHLPSAPTIDSTLPAGPTEEELACALDEVMDALRAGRPVDRDELLRRYPPLAGPLDTLLQLVPPAPGQVSLAPPARIGPYVIHHELGAGGFGVVYQAHDPDIKRDVAVKLLHPGRLAQPEALSRFQREACVTARLAHPGIVRLLDYSRAGPPHYLVTELIDGVDPCTWARTTGADLRAVVDLVARIAEALDHAHQAGVCHRDLKPANVLIDGAGNPHVLDFGLARVLGGEESQTPTQDGCILGSLAYMAPEQAAGESHQADARSDVYSLGVILFELMTGRLPFEGPALSLPTRVVEEDPASPHRLNRAVPRVLEAICLKAMAKRPAQRYPAAGALARDLRAWLAGDAVEAREQGLLSRVGHFLGRRHRDTLSQGWTRLLLLMGLTIFAGCATANYWEWRLEGDSGPYVFLTKVVQVAVMLFLAVRLRPLAAPHMTAAERQIWTLVPAYYGSTLTLVVVNYFLEPMVPLAPMLAILSGMGFMSLGATIWGWFYVWGVGFYLLAILIAVCQPFGLTILGAGWFISLVIGAIQLRLSN